MLVNLPIGPPAAVYMGTYGASAVLTKITDCRTNGTVVTETFPQSFVQSLNSGAGSNIQSGNHSLEVTLEFYSDSLMTARLTRGLPIDWPYINTPPGVGQYAVLLVGPDPEGISNFYFPLLRSTNIRALPYKKTVGTTTAVTLNVETRNPITTLFYQDTLANLAVIMGSISPV